MAAAGVIAGLFYTTMPLAMSRRDVVVESAGKVHEIAAGGSTS
ncbi:hypothetical protein B0G69_3505 [Paraburkholderia sp. RAU2J]|nr:hypothetical protein [Paraburkholderia sp. RAU2J]RKT27674.1 hypothetical protein B0G69_3505 [Paraburkholderia sp. RAU2J]